MSVQILKMQNKQLLKSEFVGQPSQIRATSGVTLYRGPPLQNFRRPPSRSAKGTSRAPYMHEFSTGSRACSSAKFLNLDSLKCNLLDFGERFYRILMVRKRHCSISEALANVFALLPKPGGPIWPIGVGGLGFSWSQPIVVTPLSSTSQMSEQHF